MISGAQKAKFSGLQIVLGILLALALGFVGYNVWTIIQDSARDSENGDKVGDLRASSANLTTYLRGPLPVATMTSRSWLTPSARWTAPGSN